MLSRVVWVLSCRDPGLKAIYLREGLCGAPTSIEGECKRNRERNQVSDHSTSSRPHLWSWDVRGCWVAFISQDSFKEFPKLILQHRGKRIGLFIDGPKGELAVKLCMKMLKFSSDVVYCLFHDFLPDGFDWGTKDGAIYKVVRWTFLNVLKTLDGII